MLPFDSPATIHDQGGAQVGTVDVSIRKLPSPRETRTGETYTWVGEADAAAAGELEGRVNRHLIVDGRRLNVISAVAFEALPHVQLLLYEVRQGGSA